MKVYDNNNNNNNDDDDKGGPQKKYENPPDIQHIGNTKYTRHHNCLHV